MTSSPTLHSIVRQPRWELLVIHLSSKCLLHFCIVWSWRWTKESTIFRKKKSRDLNRTREKDEHVAAMDFAQYAPYFSRFQFMGRMAVPLSVPLMVWFWCCFCDARMKKMLCHEERECEKVHPIMNNKYGSACWFIYSVFWRIPSHFKPAFQSNYGFLSMIRIKIYNNNKR